MESSSNTSPKTRRKKNAGKYCFFASGVIKIDYRFAGYPDIRKFADEWAKEPNFRTIIIRYVSERNLGIQFLYLDTETDYPEAKKKFDKLFEMREEAFNEVYAIDVDMQGFGDCSQREDFIIVHKPLQTEEK